MLKQNFNMHAFWWFFVSFANILLLAIFYQTTYWTDIFTDLTDTSMTVLCVSNILVAVLVRNELILHVLYRLAVWISVKIPYLKYYFNSSVHYIGGVHASCATWGFLWLIIDELRQLGDPSDPLSTATSSDPISITTSSILLTLLFIIILTALPPLRHKLHDTFEISHRYLGWACLSLLVLHQARFQFMITLNQAYPPETLLTNPVLLMIALMIFSVFLPWVTLERFEDYTIDCPSPGVLVLTIPGMADVGTFARISIDGIEWHSFSVAGVYFDQQTHESRLRLVIGAAGDWTKSLIDRIHKNNLPKCIWIRRVKPPGFMFSINAYSRVLIITTGAGIAPALPYLASKGHKVCLLWIGNDHRETYGEDIWLMVTAHPRHRIYDTGLYGRPDIENLAIQTAKEFKVQAVFCVSNKPVTQKVVKICLSKGIPAYGATWDS